MSETNWQWNDDYSAAAAVTDSGVVAVITQTYDVGYPDACDVPPTIYGSEWWADRRHGELYSTCRKDVSAPDWDVVKRALDHYGEHVKDVAREDSMTRRYLRAFWDVRAADVLTSTVDQYTWAITLVTGSWLEHVGLSESDEETLTTCADHSEVSAYLDGDVYDCSAYYVPELRGVGPAEAWDNVTVDDVLDGYELASYGIVYGEDEAMLAAEDCAASAELPERAGSYAFKADVELVDDAMLDSDAARDAIVDAVKRLFDRGDGEHKVSVFDYNGNTVGAVETVQL